MKKTTRQFSLALIWYVNANVSAVYSQKEDVISGKSKVKHVSVTPAPAPVPAAEDPAVYRGGGDPLKGLNISKAGKEMLFGDYYALIIGIDNYQGHWTPLNNATKDAKAVEKLLREKYKIEYFKTMYNEDATRTNIIKAMEWLAENVKEKDNVFIFYSGH